MHVELMVIINTFEVSACANEGFCVLSILDAMFSYVMGPLGDF